METIDLDALPDAVVVFDETLCLVAANRRAEELFGASGADLVGTVPLDRVHPDDLAIVAAANAALQSKVRGTCIEFRVRAHGEWRMVEVIGSTFDTPAGRRSVLSMRDMSERRRWEVAAGDDSQFRTIVAQSSTWLSVMSPDSVISSSSWAATRLLGWDLERVEGALLADMVVPGDRQRVLDELAAAASCDVTTRFEASVLTASGSSVPFRFEVVNLCDDPTVAALVVSAHDITELRAAHDRLEFLASHDPLTGLANRASLEAFLSVQLERHRDDPAQLGALFVDLDGFKPVNDLHGHEAGDEVLRVLARRLSAVLRPGDLSARFGGDEFVVVCLGATDLEVVAARVEAALSTPVALDGVTVSVGASVGWVTASAGQSPSDVIAAADAAMYAVKSRRYGHGVCDLLSLSERRCVAESLASSFGVAPDVAPEGLELVFQPVLRPSSGDVVAVEALLRWRHPLLGPLSPTQFLPVVSAAGFDEALGRWVLRTAAVEVAARADLGGVGVAVNVAASHAASPSLVGAVTDALRASGLDPSRLWLEVSESAMSERVSGSVAPQLDELRRRAVMVAVDDFGTGQSSLASVLRWPADVVKIDREFVSEVASSSVAFALVSSVVALAHATGRVVVAEGVDDLCQHDVLAAAGVDYVQGFLYAAPCPLAEFVLGPCPPRPGELTTSPV